VPLLQLSSKNKKKKRANLNRAGVVAVAAACAAAAVGAGPQAARAIPVPTPPPPSRVDPNATPSSTPNSTILPLDSSLFFILDGTITSHSKPGTVVRAHLRDPIVLSGVTVARAGTPVDIEVTQSSPAQAGNVDGSVDVYFDSMTLADGKKLPLVTPTAHISPHMTAGQQSTRGITDTVGDIFIPGHVIYHMLRKGGDVTLRPGTLIRARTAATITLAHHGAYAINTPAPFNTSLETPHPGFVPAPVYTPPGFVPQTPKPSPSAKPTATP
jgi:hypothetical protein